MVTGAGRWAKGAQVTGELFILIPRAVRPRCREAPEMAPAGSWRFWTNPELNEDA